jgi:enoyl-CoA hydratase
LGKDGVMSESPTCFDVERIGKVAHVRLNRPDVYNSMIKEFWSELPAVVRDLDEDGSVRAIVISSTGKHFCSGMDLGVFASGGGDALGGPSADGSAAEQGRARARLLQSVRVLQESFTALERVRMPVIAAIQGGCIGGAVDMVSAATSATPARTPSSASRRSTSA